MKDWLIKKLGVDWYYALVHYVESHEFKKLGETIALERKNNTIYPSRQDMFKAFRLCKLSMTKVVILGQDPYHDGSADGLAFSNAYSKKLSPSLRNILNEARSTKWSNGDLSSWAEQGVLLLNTAQTVIEGKPGSHIKLWEEFTNNVIGILNTKPNLIIVLFGNYAKAFKSKFNKYHIIFEEVHPSPLSAHRGFIGCNVFAKINEELDKMNKKQISW